MLSNTTSLTWGWAVISALSIGKKFENTDTKWVDHRSGTHVHQAHLLPA